MEANLISLISNGGAFALAVFLVVYTIKQNERREERLHAEAARREGEISSTAEKRESRLLGILEKQAEHLEEIGHILADIQKQLPKQTK